MTDDFRATSGLANPNAGSLTDDSQTPRGAGISMAEILRPTHKTKIGCWNVRTMFQASKLEQVTKESERYNIDILGISEARWTGAGKRRLTTGHTLLYSGRSDDQHLQGVALLMTKEVESSLIEWNPISERLLTARFHSRFTKLTIITCYAPTEEAEEEDKDKFYDKLQEIASRVPRHDMLVVIGDLNAKIGGDNTGKERTMGNQGMGEMNNNGQRLYQWCSENNLVIGGSIFQHRNIHKYTWTSPGGKTQNQIDHFIINRKWRKSLQDVRTKRGADVGSDHQLVVGRLCLKLRRNKDRKERGRQYDVNKLLDEGTKKEFQTELRNRFEVLQEGQELNLANFNIAVRQSAETTLGFRKKKKECWISTCTWEKIAERKEVKRKLNQTRSERVKEQLRQKYTKADKDVKKHARKDKKQYYENLATEAETAARKQDMKTLYKITTELRGGHKNTEPPVKDKNGLVITSETEKIKRWKEHFETILNREEPRLRADIKPAERDLDIDINCPSISEIKESLKMLKNGKAPGADQITAELLKAEETITPAILYEVFKNIWESEEAPEEWKIGLIIKLPKKGDLGNCNNWRGITLQSQTCKVFSRIILCRISKAVDKTLRQEQAGFRKGRSCSDQIFALRQILEQSAEWKTALYATFIDFEKAFDSLHRDSLWKIMRHYGISQKLVNVTKLLYNDFKSAVIHENTLTDTFEVKTGVKQGCILSPFLFILAIDWLMKTTMKGTSRGIRWNLARCLEDLDFADDLCLISSRQQDMQGKTNDLDKNGKKIGLKIHSGKTKVLKVNTRSDKPITIGENKIDEVQVFTYLGAKVTGDGSCESEINSRLAKARHVFASLRAVWKTNNISVTTKSRLYKSNILSVLLYGCESWKMTSTISHNLEVFQNRCLRRIFNIYWPNTIRTEELLKRSHVQPVTTVVKQRRWRWIGHVLRMPQASNTRIAMRWTPEGKRPRGRPKETWRRTVERELKETGETWGSLQKTAQDRLQWRSLVEALCATQHEED
jgi:hypothetical protein